MTNPPQNQCQHQTLLLRVNLVWIAFSWPDRFVSLYLMENLEFSAVDVSVFLIVLFLLLFVVVDVALAC